MADLGWPELAIIALAVVLLFGWKRMPDMARSLGRSARIFKSEMDQMHSAPDRGHDAGPVTDRTRNISRGESHDTGPVTVHEAVSQADARVAAADAEVARLRAEIMRRKHANGSP